MAVREVITLIVASTRELLALLCEIRSIMYITCLLGSIFFASFWKYGNRGSGKRWVFWLPVREKSGNFDSHIEYEPCISIWNLFSKFKDAFSKMYFDWRTGTYIQGVRGQYPQMKHFAWFPPPKELLRLLSLQGDFTTSFVPLGHFFQWCAS